MSATFVVCQQLQSCYQCQKDSRNLDFLLYHMKTLSQVKVYNGVPERSAWVCGDILLLLSRTECHHMCTDAFVEGISANLAFSSRAAKRLRELWQTTHI